MDFELKIGAVFSLAEDEKKEAEVTTETESAEDTDLFNTPDILLPDKDSDEVDIMFGMNPVLPNTGATEFPSEDPSCIKTDRRSFEDPDAPPSLLLEGPSSPGLSEHSPQTVGKESMSPPILQREEPEKKDSLIDETSQPKKKKCTRIAPCYIVLTNIDSLMKQNTCISCRMFKSCFIECSNMCKKIQFKRRLLAGKDVFNVKTPSKQKDYLLYLTQAEKERSKKGKKRLIVFTQIKDIIEKHDLKVALRKKAAGKRALARVRRTVSRLPNDFATQPTNSSILINDEKDEVQKKTSKEDIALLNALMVKKQHKVELDSLKKMITIKRSLNYNLKRTKRSRTEGYETFLRSDVTSSVSGRVRKANPRYGKEFAVSRRDFEEQRLVEDAHARLKRNESENKKIVENYKSKESLKIGKKRKDSNVEKVTPDQPDSAKRAKMIDVVIDNPEECYVKSYESKHKTSRKKDSGTTKRKKRSSSVSADSDGVLIQDMPNEENVISDFLHNLESNEKNRSASRSPEAKGYIKVEPGSQHGDQYLRAKQLLKDSLDNRNSYLRQALSTSPQFMPVPVSTLAPVTVNNKAMEQEKYKMLKIPETVQKLFTNKEIKKEPVEEAADPSNTTVPSTVSPRVVTVYSNGNYQKILLNAPPDRQVVPTTKAQTKNAEINLSPVLVNTVHGLRYLIPTQSVVKDRIPSYSEAVKTLRFPFKPAQSSTVVTTTMSNKTLNTTASFGSVSGATQSLQTIVYPVQLNQQQQQQQQQGGKQPQTVSLLSSVVPVSANPTTLMGPRLPTPTMNTNPSVLNKNTQQPATGMSNSALTREYQTQTLSHKVLPVSSSRVSHNQTVRSVLAMRKNLSVKPQTVVSERNSGIISNGNRTIAEDQIQKPAEKCKFYLLKIDGKNVLIPINGEQVPPKAYVINNDIIAGTTQTQNVSRVASVSTPGNVASTIGIRPTILGLQSVEGGGQQKPTMAVMPNMKQLDQMMAAQGTVSSPRQTVTLTKAGVVGGMNVFNSLANTTQPVTKPGSNSIKTQQVSKPSTVVPRTTMSKPTIIVSNTSRTHDQILPAAVYVRQLASSQVSNYIVHGETSKGSAKSHETLPLALMSNTAIDHDHKGYSNQYMQTNEKQSLLGATKSITKGFGKKENEVNVNPDIADKGELCEKSGIFSIRKTSDDTQKQSKGKPDQSKEGREAFKEAVTTREERLRRLKELLKEKQKAVEELRNPKVKSE